FKLLSRANSFMSSSIDFQRDSNKIVVSYANLGSNNMATRSKGLLAIAATRSFIAATSFSAIGIIDNGKILFCKKSRNFFAVGNTEDAVDFSRDNYTCVFEYYSSFLHIRVVLYQSRG